MPNKVMICPARWTDAGALANIVCRAIQAIDDSVYSQADKATWLHNANSILFWQQHLPSSCPVVAKQDGKVVGFVEYRVAQAYIDCWYIDPLYQR